MMNMLNWMLKLKHFPWCVRYPWTMLHFPALRKFYFCLCIVAVINTTKLVRAYMRRNPGFSCEDTPKMPKTIKHHTEPNDPLELQNMNYFMGCTECNI